MSSALTRRYVPGEILNGDEQQNRPACAGVDYINFFPEGNPDEIASQRQQAIAVCAGCLVAARCTAYADAIGAQHGIWGGHARGTDEDLFAAGYKQDAMYLELRARGWSLARATRQAGLDDDEAKYVARRIRNADPSLLPDYLLMALEHYESRPNGRRPQVAS